MRQPRYRPPDSAPGDVFNAYRGETVVVDTDSRLTYIGTLAESRGSLLVLRNLTIYDAEEARIQLDQFLVECVAYGITPARRELLLPVTRVLSISRLQDILIPGKTDQPPS